MQLLVNQRYLSLPISYTAQEKRLLFYRNGCLVSDIAARLDSRCPDTYEYLDMGRFLGEILTVETVPEVDLVLGQTDTADSSGLYQEKYRPAVHFSASRGWINDPNGLLWANGTYHMFFQFNPAGRDWGNMHWGHAVSTDLLHWEQRDIALFPDEMGTMFSGSGIVDTDNVTGLKTTEQDVIVLFYTAAGGTSRLSEGKPFTQCMAYSTDGGETFRKYSKNPLIEEIAEGNRDPKVVYNPELSCYYLALFLKDSRFALLSSKDLIHWKRRQEIALPEDNECPDLFPLKADGGKETLWVLCGASDRYLVGKFGPDGCFHPVQPAKRLHYGTNSYAAQSFSGVTDGRTLRIAWCTAEIPQSPFNCAMCTPTEMSLKFVGNEYWLCTLPTREIESICAQKQEVSDARLNAGDMLTLPLSGKAQDIRLQLSSGENAPFCLKLLGIEIHVDPRENSLKCKDSKMPLFMNGHKITLRIITDVNAVEVYANQGEAFLCQGHIADYTLNRLTIEAGKSHLELYQVQAAELKSVWSDRLK